jgi:hypothetical protein
MRNIKKRELKVSANQSARTFTIRITYPDGTKFKYRTYPMNQQEFDSEEMNSENDWNYFLRSNDYYVIKK